jgi:hypothetical protein
MVMVFLVQRVQQDQNTLGSKLAVVEGGGVDGDEVADE